MAKLKEVYIQVWSLLNEDTARGKGLRLGYFLLLYFFIRIFLKAGWVNAYNIDSPVHRLLADFITRVSVFFLRLFYGDIAVSHDFIISISGKPCIELLPGCNGFTHIVEINLTLSLYPMTLKQKLIMLPVTVLILLFAAVLHFMILIPISYNAREWYGFSHNYFTKTLFFAFYFLCWIIWEKLRNGKKMSGKSLN